MSRAAFVPHRGPMCLVVSVSHVHAPHHHGTPIPLVLLEQAVHCIVPWLRQRDWACTSSMLIPSMLASASLLRCRLRASSAERAAALEACIEDLLRAFVHRHRPPAVPPPAPGGPHE